MDFKELYPAFGKEAAVVVFAVDENYAPYLAVTLKSLIENSRAIHAYDLLILSSDLSENTESRLLKLVEGRSNFSLRFIDVNACLAEFAATLHLGSSDHVSLATYLRLFVCRICQNYSRLIYLDCDIVVLADIAELFQTDLENKAVGGVLDFFGYLDFMVRPETLQDWLNDLGLKPPYHYFNAGVLLFDLDRLRALDFETQCMPYLTGQKRVRLHDQDVLNAICQDTVKFIDPAWNSQAWVEVITQERLFPGVSPELYASFKQAGDSPKIIHYLTQRKPWFYPGPKMAKPFWHYAAQTDFYQDILLANLAVRSWENELMKKFIRHPHGKLTLWFYQMMACLTTGESKAKYQKRVRFLKENLKAIKKMVRG